MPDFYVVVNFIPSEEQYVGGIKRADFLRVVVHHLAAVYPDTAEGSVKRIECMAKSHY